MIEQFERLLDANPSAALMPALDAAGYLDVLRELTLTEVEPLLRVLGRRGIAEPIAAIMAARAAPGPTRELLAVMATAEIAGGAERLLDMSVGHANTRQQFGKPIGKFQAIQQQLALLAEKAVLVRIAAQAACAHGLKPPIEAAATAKSIGSSAVPSIAAIAHAVHGAIGITAEYPLARLTARLHALRMAHGAEGYWNRKLGEARLRCGPVSSLEFIRSV